MLHVCAKWPCREGRDATHVQHLLLSNREQGALKNNWTLKACLSKSCFVIFLKKVLNMTWHQLNLPKMISTNFLTYLDNSVWLLLSHFVSRYLNLEEALTPLRLYCSSKPGEYTTAPLPSPGSADLLHCAFGFGSTQTSQHQNKRNKFYSVISTRYKTCYNRIDGRHDEIWITKLQREIWYAIWWNI